jgi:hypothetical protein
MASKEVELGLLSGASTPADPAGVGAPVADFFGGEAALKSVAGETPSLPPGTGAKQSAPAGRLSTTLQKSRSKLLGLAKNQAPAGPLLQDQLKADQISLRAALQVSMGTVASGHRAI